MPKGSNQPRRAIAEAAFRARAERDGVVVLGNYVSKSVPVSCICPNGHPCAPQPGNIRRGRGWCLVCAGKCTVTAEANFRMKAAKDGVRVVGAYVNKDTPIHCICPNGHDTYPTAGSVQQGHWWCRICVNNDKTTAATNFLARAKRDGVTVIGRYVTAHTPVLSRCPAGHECSPTPNNIRTGHGWCVACVQAYDRLYVVSARIDGTRWGKIGVAGGAARAREHAGRGWVLEFEASGLEHAVAVAAERHVLRVLAPYPKLRKDALPQDGYTETFPYEHVGLVVETLTGYQIHVASAG